MQKFADNKDQMCKELKTIESQGNKTPDSKLNYTTYTQSHLNSARRNI